MTAYTLREVAAETGESLSTIRRRIADGALEATQRGANTSPLLVTREALDAYLASRRPRPTALECSEARVRRIVRDELRACGLLPPDDR